MRPSTAWCRRTVRAGTGPRGPTAGRGRGDAGRIAKAIAPLRLPADLLAFWRAVDPDTLAVAPCPRPADPELSLRLWQEHLAGEPSLHRFFPWCYESHDFLLVELDGPDARPSRHGCCSWGGQSTPAVRAFGSVTAYVDLLATMIELREFTHHPELGVIEFDPARYWADAQAVRLAAERPRARPRPPTSPRPGTDDRGGAARGGRSRRRHRSV